MKTLKGLFFIIICCACLSNASAQTKYPVGDLPYLGIYSTSKRIVRVDNYRLDKNHRIILEDPKPIHVDTITIYNNRQGDDALPFDEDSFPVTELSSTFSDEWYVGDRIFGTAKWEIRYYDNENKVRSIHGKRFYYNKDGQVEKTIEYYEGGYSMLVEYHYNDFGDVDLEKSLTFDYGYDADYAIDSSEIEYKVLEWDEYGHWTKRIGRDVHNSSSTAYTIAQTRTIEYGEDPLPFSYFEAY